MTTKMSLPKARIIGLGSYLPSKVLSNRDLEKIVDTTDEWIVTRTGMQERRIAAADEFPSDMGVMAAKQAIKAANLEENAIEMIIVATMSPDYISPSTANLIQAQLDAPQAASMDINAACTGFIYALSIANAYVKSGIYKYVLVIATEKMSAFIDYKDRSTCVLFGDGAAAAVVAANGQGLSIDNVVLGSEGKLANLMMIPAGGSRHKASEETVSSAQHYFKMSGSEVFKHAVRRMSQVSEECLTQAGLQADQIDWLVPHQANKRIIDALAKRFAIPEEKIYHTIRKYGNTSASSIAIALHELTEKHPLALGDHLLLTAFGVGLAWGAIVLTKCT